MISQLRRSSKVPNNSNNHVDSGWTYCTKGVVLSSRNNSSQDMNKLRAQMWVTLN